MKLDFKMIRGLEGLRLMPPVQESATSVLLCKSMREARVSRHDAFGKLSQTDELLIKIISTALSIFFFFFCLDYKEGQIHCKRQHELILERQAGDCRSHGNCRCAVCGRTSRLFGFFNTAALFNSAHHSLFYKQ